MLALLLCLFVFSSTATQLEARPQSQETQEVLEQARQRLEAFERRGYRSLVPTIRNREEANAIGKEALEILASPINRLPLAAAKENQAVWKLAAKAAVLAQDPLRAALVAAHFLPDSDQDHALALDLRQLSFPRAIELAEKHRRACRSLRSKAEAGDATAMVQLGRMYQSGRGVFQDGKSAMQWYRRAKSAGNIEAGGFIASLYGSGLGLEKDEEEAEKLARAAAEQGSLVGMTVLSYLYAFGPESKRDLKLAVQYARQAAEGGYDVGMGNYGYFLLSGTGVRKDEEAAFHWHKKAAELEVNFACRNLAFQFQNGTGTPKDLEQARIWFEEAAALGHKDAFLDLANLQLYEFKDEALARAWYQRGAFLENVNAQAGLGYLFHEGKGGPRNPSAAEYWYTQGAEQGNTTCMRNLSLYYEWQGKGKSSLKKALSWANKAQQAGHPKGKEDAKRIESKLSSAPPLAMILFETSRKQKDRSYQHGLAGRTLDWSDPNSKLPTNLPGEIFTYPRAARSPMGIGWGGSANLLGYELQMHKAPHRRFTLFGSYSDDRLKQRFEKFPLFGDGEIFHPSFVSTSKNRTLLFGQSKSIQGKRRGDLDICAQYLDFNGQSLWKNPEEKSGMYWVASSPFQEHSYQAMADEEGGAYVVYVTSMGDYRAPSWISVQRISKEGQLLWTDRSSATNAVFAHPSYRVASPKMVSDGEGGAIVAFELRKMQGDGTLGDCDIYAQRILPDGSFAWGKDNTPVPLANTPFEDDQFDLVADGEGGAVMVWRLNFLDHPAAIAKARISGTDGSHLWIEDNGSPTLGPNLDLPLSNPKIGITSKGWLIFSQATTQDEQGQEKHALVYFPIFRDTRHTWLKGDPDPAGNRPLVRYKVVSASSYDVRNFQVASFADHGVLVVFELAKDDAENAIMAQVIDQDGDARLKVDGKTRPWIIGLLQETDCTSPVIVDLYQ